MQQVWLKTSAISKICSEFSGKSAQRTRVVVVHHPLEHLIDENKRLMRNAGLGLEELSDCGTDLVLSGHVHSWHASLFAVVEGRRSALQVHAGTSLSNRLRGEINDFNLLEVSSNKITMCRHAFSDTNAAFSVVATSKFVAGPAGWSRAVTNLTDA